MSDCSSPTPGETPLHKAAFWGRSELTTLLLQAGADPNARDANGEEIPLWMDAKGLNIG